MSKKIVWIWSLCGDFSTAGVNFASSLIYRPNKFQKGLKEFLSPGWEVTFVNEDLSTDIRPNADVTVTRYVVSRYLEKEKYNNLVIVSEMDILEQKYATIESKILQQIYKCSIKEGGNQSE